MLDFFEFSLGEIVYIILVLLSALGEYMGKVGFLLSSLHIVLYITIKVLLSIAVYRDALSKHIASRRLWVFITAVFGFFGALIYALFTVKLPEKGGKKFSLIVISICMLFAINCSVFSLYTVQNMKNNLLSEYNSFDDEVTFEKEGKRVKYDKMGNAYTKWQLKNFLYYDRDGKSYKLVSSGIEVYKFICQETNQVYNLDDDKSIYVLDKGGYLSFLSYDEIPNSDRYSAIIYDTHSNIYYSFSNCYWDADGNMFFDSEISEFAAENYSDIYSITIEDIIEADLKKGFLRTKPVIENGEFVFYDKMGNRYDYANKGDMLYYTYNNDVYKMLDADYDDGGFISQEEGSMSTYIGNAAINKDGYLVNIEDCKMYSLNVHSDDDIALNEVFVYYNDNGEIYYPAAFCNWDKDGNLLFVNDEIKITKAASE